MQPIFDERRYLIPFRSALLPQIFTDTLVIGSGVAGLRAALAACEHGDVIVLAKGKAEQSNTAWAQGGIAAVQDAATDSVEEHVRNTLDAGAGLCDEPVVRRIVEAGPAAMQELIAWGMRFDRDTAGGLLLGREGGHTAHRILHADGDATGAALASTLLAVVRGRERIRLFDDCFALDLLTDGGSGRCLGAITHHPRFGLQVIWAKATILASGGCGQLYRETTNPSVATGDGLAMAYRAGAAVADVEFMQFHPTTLYVAGASRSLITEAVRGEGAYLVDRAGHRFMLGVHPMAELAPRDIVSRAILREVRSSGAVFLDARHIGTHRFAQRFPGIYALLQKFDIDPGQDLIPVRPAAHYMIGGVRADERGRTNIEGFYACGEAACTGLHGANRLASNSLLEGLVCGEAAGRASLESVEKPPRQPMKLVSDIRPSDRMELDLDDVRSSVRSLLWRHVGIERDGSHLREVREMLEFWARYTLDKIFDEREGWEAQNMLLAAALITRGAAWRAESRGTHYRLDHPNPNPEFRFHATWKRGEPEPQLHRVADAVLAEGAEAAHSK